jgi:glutaminase
VPQQLGIAVFSPLLNEQGHSVRASKVCAALSQHFSLHAFDPYERRTKLQEAIRNPSLRGGL